MKRIDTSTRAIDLFGAGKDGFKDGNLALGVAPTDFNAAWTNGIQEEILAVVEAAGIAPSGANLAQLREAIGFFSTGRLLQFQRFLNNSVIAAPLPGARTILVRMRGGGGASGGTPATAAGTVAVSGPGAGGGYIEVRLSVADLVFPITVVVGAGGVGVVGANGGNGGTSSFGAYAQATGGGGGGTAAATGSALLVPGSGAPGLGTAPAGVVTACAGGAGGFSQILSTVAFSAGDGGACGDGAPGGVRSGVVSNFGAGAGGRAVGTSSGATAGLNGGAGVVTVEQFS